MAHRNFDAERAALDPVSFELGGITFKCKREVRPEAILRYEAMDPATATGAESMEVADELIAAAILPEQVEDWRRLRALEGPDELGVSLLADLCAWLIEQVVNRPLAPLSSSSDGSTAPTTGTSSTDASSSPVTPLASAG